MNAIHMHANLSLAEFLKQCDPFGGRIYIGSMASLCVNAWDETIGEAL